MKKLLVSRLKEPSTWMGIAMLATLIGIPPEIIATGTKIVAAVSSIIGVALPENKA